MCLSNQQICCEGNTKCGRNCLLIGEQWESRCLNVGMSELRVKTIILPHVAQHEREISKKRAGSCSPPGVMGNYNERGSPTPGHVQPVLALQASWASAQDSKMHCHSPCQEGAGRKLITSGLLARAEQPRGVVNAAAFFSGPKNQGHICTSGLFYFYLCFIKLKASESLGKSTDPESSISLHWF